MTDNDQTRTSIATALPDGRERWPRGRRPMSLGLMVPISQNHAFGDERLGFRDMLEITRVAEDVGFDVAWFADHFVFGGANGEPLRGVWECWTSIAGIAAATERIHLGSLVACTGYRNPALQAKMAETVDEISGGRLILGLGAGWHKPEYDMFGYPFDHRASRFEEAIQILQPLLRGQTVTYQGFYERAEGCVNIPPGPRPGGIPILVGTDGPRMLRLTARFADAWNTVWHNDPARVVPLLEQVDIACGDVGRDPATLIRTAGGNIALSGYLGRRRDPIEGPPDVIAERLRGFEALGLSHFVCGIDPCTPRSVEEFGRVIELLDA